MKADSTNSTVPSAALAAVPAPGGPKAANPESAPSDHRTVNLTVNGISHAARMHSFTTLLDALRDHFGLTGTKKGCDAGACGVCTVLLDNRRINSCVALAALCEGCEISTIEGVAKDGRLHPLQKAFIEYDALQCGYCTPGQIMAAIGFLGEGHSDPADPAIIREQMSGNLCRCGAYPNIVVAIAAAAREVQ